MTRSSVLVLIEIQSSWGQVVRTGGSDERTIIGRPMHSSTDCGVRWIYKFDISPPARFPPPRHRHSQGQDVQGGGNPWSQRGTLGDQPQGEVPTTHQNGPLKPHHHHPRPSGISSPRKAPDNTMPTASSVCQNAAHSSIQRPSLVISSRVASGVPSLMKIPIRVHTWWQTPSPTSSCTRCQF